MRTEGCHQADQASGNPPTHLPLHSLSLPPFCFSPLSLPPHHPHTHPPSISRCRTPHYRHCSQARTLRRLLLGLGGRERVGVWGRGGRGRCCGGREGVRGGLKGEETRCEQRTSGAERHTIGERANTHSLPPACLPPPPPLLSLLQPHSSLTHTHTRTQRPQTAAALSSSS